ncbi:MAG: translation initiation factor IF-2 N-terminal domain-containing protein, partial [Parvularculaceae bacterium]|nr:translation initiation factor IF-2 N-terminal domain-containing protein [Parvularculaceae bacterium]
MSDDVDTKSESEARSGRRPLSLRRTETGAVKQSFSHGRSKTVVVETKKRRVLTPKKGGDADKAAPKREKAAAPAAPETKAAQKGADKTDKKAAPTVLRTLSEDEKQARAAALATARKEAEARRERDEAERAEREAREAEERSRLEDEKKRLAEEDAKREREAAERRRAEEEAKRLLEEEDRERKARAAAKSDTRAKGRPAAEKPAEPEDPDNPLAKFGGRLKTKRKPTIDRSDRENASKEAPRRRSGRLTIVNALEDDADRQRSLASVKRAREREKLARQQRGGGGKAVVREVVIPETITVQELAQRMAMRAVDLIRELMKQGQMVTANATLDADTAELIVTDLGHTVKRVSESDVEEGLIGADDSEDTLAPRAPVVTIMG